MDDNDNMQAYARIEVAPVRLPRTKLNKILDILEESGVEIKFSIYGHKAPMEHSGIKARGRRPIPYSDDFNRFWLLYPRKVGKKRAFSTWRHCDKHTSLPSIEKIEDALAIAIDSEAWRNENGKYIPHAETWLRDARWEDAL